MQLFMLILCGDIGASNSRLAILEIENQRFSFKAKEFFKNSNFSNFNEILSSFLKTHPFQFQIASFGVAGPVQAGEVEITNLSWKLSSRGIGDFLKIKKSFLLNDLEAIAYGIPLLESSQCREIILGNVNPGPQAVIAPGSGIGEAILFWDGKQHYPMPTEGGHASFSPTSKIQLELLQYLFKEFEHVSWERVLSGPGIFNLFKFLRATNKYSESEAFVNGLQTDGAAAQITDAAIYEKNEICVKVVELFFEILATECGNLALKCIPTAGLFIAGGITPKLMPLFNQALFLKNFLNKGRMSILLENIPVTLILSEDVGILGAANYAKRAHSGSSK